MGYSNLTPDLGAGLFWGAAPDLNSNENIGQTGATTNPTYFLNTDMNYGTSPRGAAVVPLDSQTCVILYGVGNSCSMRIMSSLDQRNASKAIETSLLTSAFSTVYNIVACRLDATSIFIAYQDGADAEYVIVTDITTTPVVSTPVTLAVGDNSTANSAIGPLHCHRLTNGDVAVAYATSTNSTQYKIAYNSISDPLGTPSLGTEVDVIASRTIISEIPIAAGSQDHIIVSTYRASSFANPIYIAVTDLEGTPTVGSTNTITVVTANNPLLRIGVSDNGYYVLTYIDDDGSGANEKFKCRTVQIVGNTLTTLDGVFDIDTFFSPSGSNNYAVINVDDAGDNFLITTNPPSSENAKVYILEGVTTSDTVAMTVDERDGYVLNGRDLGNADRMVFIAGSKITNGVVGAIAVSIDANFNDDGYFTRIV